MDFYDEYEDNDVRLEEVEPGYWTVFSADGNSTYYCSDAYSDCKLWCKENDMHIVMITSYKDR